MALVLHSLQLAILALSVAQISNVVGATMISINSKAGIITGIRQDGDGFKFLGIPYAQASRWMPPTSVAPFDDPLLAFTFKPSSSQIQTTGNRNPRAGVNRSHTKSLLPVLVVIHGGSFKHGGADTPILNAQTLTMSINAIVVTFNYRLSIFGFIGADAIGSSSHNYGILDQRAAIEWVSRNIEAFGGDPTKVTLAGQSAGAMAALAHAANPNLKSKFRNLILMSPPAVLLRSPKEANADTVKIGARLKCTNHLNATELGRCLREASTRQLLDALDNEDTNENNIPNLNSALMAVLDGSEFPAHPNDILGNATALSDRNIMIGSTSNETAKIVNDNVHSLLPLPFYNVLINGLFLDRADDIRSMYSSFSPNGITDNQVNKAIVILSDYIFGCAPQRSMRHLAKSAPQSKLFSYFWETPWTGSLDDPVGRMCGDSACHTTDLAMLFRSPSDLYGASMTMAFRQYISNFLLNSDPNGLVSTSSPDETVKKRMPFWTQFNSGATIGNVIRFAPAPSNLDQSQASSPVIVLEPLHPNIEKCTLMDTVAYGYEAQDLQNTVDKASMSLPFLSAFWLILIIVVTLQCVAMGWAKLLYYRIKKLMELLQESQMSVKKNSLFGTQYKKESMRWTRVGNDIHSADQNMAAEYDGNNDDECQSVQSEDIERGSVCEKSKHAESVHMDSRLLSVLLDSRPSPIAVECRNLTYEIGSRRSKKTILEDLSFCCMPGSMTALIGPSGAGKTTLMSLLASRIGNSHTQQSILYGGQSLDKLHTGDMQRLVGFVTQHRPPFIGLTPKEVLIAYGKLVLPAGTTAGQLARRVAYILHLLGLTSCADTVIQDASQNKGGISGGQLGRIPIGVALLKQPSVLILDEPTSGLDSRSSLEVMHILAQLAQQGYTIIVSIHQPRHEIFLLFTDLIVLACGRLLFKGEPQQCIRFAGAVKSACGRSSRSLALDQFEIPFPNEATLPDKQSDIQKHRTNRKHHDVGTTSDLNINPADAILDIIAAIPATNISQIVQFGSKWTRTTSHDQPLQINDEPQNQISDPIHLPETSGLKSTKFYRSEPPFDGSTHAVGGDTVDGSFQEQSCSDLDDASHVSSLNSSTSYSQIFTLYASPFSTAAISGDADSRFGCRRVGILEQTIIFNARWWQTRPHGRKLFMIAVSTLSALILGLMQRRPSHDIIALLLQIKGLCLASIGMAALKNIAISFDYYTDRDMYNFDSSNGAVKPLAFFLHRLLYETFTSTIECTWVASIAYILLQCNPSPLRMASILTLICAYYNCMVALISMIYSTRLSRPEARSVTFIVLVVIGLTSGIWIQKGDTVVYTALSWIQVINPMYWFLAPMIRANIEGAGDCILMGSGGHCRAWHGDLLLQEARVDILSPEQCVGAIIVMWALFRAVQLILLIRDSRHGTFSQYYCRFISLFYRAKK
ncbi:hypothetical protein BASA62_006919 [Batrachochytrium salamandrivorans]|nr:hypothetical protein BASA62_006919 [Batrachochytrium salamandrivorans]